VVTAPAKRAEQYGRGSRSLPVAVLKGAVRHEIGGGRVAFGVRVGVCVGVGRGDWAWGLGVGVWMDGLRASQPSNPPRGGWGGTVGLPPGFGAASRADGALAAFAKGRRPAS
jgi:hypothetical protein